jgi:hypothetical protein
MGESPTLEELFREVQKLNKGIESIRQFFNISELPSLDPKKLAAAKAEKLGRKLNAKVESGS